MRDQKARIQDNQSYSVCSGDPMNTIAAEMRSLVLHAAEPVTAGETIKAQQRRAWERLSRPSFWRLRAAWYGEAGCWSARAVEDMRRRDAARRQKEAKQREHVDKLGTLFAGVAARLQAGPHADFHQHDVDALLHAARALGARPFPVAGPDKE
jgi:hypothetical protein